MREGSYLCYNLKYSFPLFQSPSLPFLRKLAKLSVWIAKWTTTINKVYMFLHGHNVAKLLCSYHVPTSASSRSLKSFLGAESSLSKGRR